MRFHNASPIPLKSFKSLDLTRSTCLFEIYLAMKLSKSLIFLASKAKCSIELCKEIGWKLPSQRSGSVGALESYKRGMLMTISSPCAKVVLGCLWKTHYWIIITILLLVSATLLTRIAFSWVVSYGNPKETLSISTFSIVVLLHSITNKILTDCDTWT